jgi:hypothetical protein
VKIGDLVRYATESLLGVGLIMSFDKDGDPVVWFQGDAILDHPGFGSAFFETDIEVISETR